MKKSLILSIYNCTAFKTQSNYWTTYIFDPILLKVLLIILVLSSSNNRKNCDNTNIDEICDDSLSIYAAQNIYVELLWRYILSCSSSEREAVKFLNKLMMFILYAQNLDLYIDTYINSLRDKVKQMESMMQTMWPNTDDEENNMNVSVAPYIIL